LVHFQYDLTSDVDYWTSRAIVFFPNGHRLSVTNCCGAYVTLSDNYFMLVPKESVTELPPFLELLDGVSEVKVVGVHSLESEFNCATIDLVRELEEFNRSGETLPPTQPPRRSPAQWWRHLFRPA
jgi:hypothetical protein